MINNHHGALELPLHVGPNRWNSVKEILGSYLYFFVRNMVQVAARICCAALQ